MVDRIRKRMEEIRDVRDPMYSTHNLADVLIIIMACVLCGCDSLRHLAFVAGERADFFREYFGITKVPSRATFGRILRIIDPKELGDAIIELMVERFGTMGGVLAVDGKAIRSTGDGNGTSGMLQILTAYVTGSGVTIAQEAINEKTNEIPTFQKMLEVLDIEGKVVTADAMHCQKKTCKRIVEKKGDYVIGLKGNQPTLHEHVESLFGNLAREDHFEIAQTVEKRSGRLETRTGYKLKDISALEHHNWPGLQSVLCIHRVTECKEKTTEELAYYVSSLDAPTIDLMYYAREHWKIESMHWMLDVVFSEDNCGLADEKAHETLNVLRKLALATHKNHLAATGSKLAMKYSMEKARMKDDYLIELITSL